MLTIRITDNQKQKIAYLKQHNVKYTIFLRSVIDAELTRLCNEYKMKEKRIKNAPDWLYD
jgi:hypothetical protein